MKSLLLLISFYSHYQPVQLSDSFPVKSKVYHATLISNQGNKVFGYLAYLNDTSIGISKKEPFFKLSGSSNQNFNYPYDGISSVALQRKNSALRGTLIGSLAGAGAGVIWGLASGDDPVTPYNGDFGDLFIALGNAFAMTAGEKALLYGVTMAVSGAVIGLVIGLIAKKKFIINGKKEHFTAMRNSLMNRTPRNATVNQSY